MFSPEATNLRILSLRTDVEAPQKLLKTSAFERAKTASRRKAFNS